MAELAGGTEKLAEQMETVLVKGEFQWAVELSDHFGDRQRAL